METRWIRAEDREAAYEEVRAELRAWLRRLHDDAVAYLDGLDQLAPPQAQPEEPAPAAPTDPVDETVSDIDESVQRLLARAMDDVAAEKARGEAPDGGDDQEDTIPLPDVTAAQPAQDGDEDDAPVSRIDFGSLQFGRDYEIK